MKRQSYDINISKDEYGAVEVSLNDRHEFNLDDKEYRDVIKSLEEVFTNKK